MNQWMLVSRLCGQESQNDGAQQTIQTATQIPTPTRQMSQMNMLSVTIFVQWLVLHQSYLH